MNRRSFLAGSLGTATFGLAGCVTDLVPGEDLDPLPPDPTLRWLRRYGESNTHEDFGTLLETEGGGFLAGGGRTRSDYAAFLVRADGTGEERWRKVFGDRPVRDAVEMPGGGFLVLVGQYDMGENELLALSADGTVRWRREPKPAERPRYEFTDLLATRNGTYLLVGRRMERVEANAEYVSERWSPVVLAVTDTGEERWERVFPAPDVVVSVDEQGDVTWGPGMERANAIVPADDGYLSLCETSEGAPYVRRLDSNGEELWRRYYGRGYNGSLRSITPRSGGYILAGHDSGGVEDTSTWGPWLLAIDDGGTPLWSYAYQFVGEGGGGSADFTAVVTDADGSPVVTGMYHPDGHQSARSRPMLGEFSPDGTRARWIRQYGDRGGMGSDVVRAGDGSFVLAGRLNEAGPWSDALLLDAGRPTESNVGPVRSVVVPTERKPGEWSPGEGVGNRSVRDGGPGTLPSRG